MTVSHLRERIERNILLELAAAPFSKEDAIPVPEASSCLDCHKRTGVLPAIFEGIAAVPGNQYVEILEGKPKNKYQQEAPEYQTCEYTAETIIADGTDKGEFRKVCANPDCPVHHPL